MFIKHNFFDIEKNILSKGHLKIMFNYNPSKVHNYHLIKFLKKKHIWLYHFIPQAIPSHYRQFGVEINMIFSTY